MDEHKRLIQETIHDVLDDGDSLLVTRRGGVTSVTDHDPSKSPSLAAHDTELYGYCATITSELDGATGCGYMILWLGIAIASCFAVDHFQPEFGEWRTYTAILGVSFFLWNRSDDVLTMRVYRAHREEMRDRLGRAGLTRERVIGLMGEDGGVDTLSTYLKKDKDLSF